MKKFKLIIAIFISFQFQNCFVKNVSKNTNSWNIDRDSLIGEFHTLRNIQKNKGYSVKLDCDRPPNRTFFINKDSTFYMFAQARCSTGPAIGTMGQWKIKRNFIIFENYPIYNDTLIKSEIINDDFITIKNIAGKVGYCLSYKNGKETFNEFDKNGLYKVKKEDVDSIIIHGSLGIFAYKTIYNKKGADNFYNFRFIEPKSFWEFYFKLKITNNYTLKGKVDDEKISLLKISNITKY